MKKTVALLLLLCMLISACLSLSSCNEDESPDEKTDPEVPMLSITEDFVVAYDNFNTRATALSKSFIDTYKEKYGLTLSRESYTKGTNELEIQIGMLKSRDEYKAALGTMTEMSTEGISVALVRASEGRLMLFGTTDDAVEVAVNHALTLFDASGNIPLDTDETIVFNAKNYKRDKTLTGYTATDLASLSQASAISVGGRTLNGFSEDVLSYTVDAKFNEGYPTVRITPLWKNSVVSVTPATEANGGVATVRITSADGTSVTTYTVNVNMNNYYETDAEIVNRSGAEATVTYVIDDGQWATAQIADSLMTKYNTLKLTFAVMIQDFATLKTKTVGSHTEYVMSGGKYTYDKKTANIDKWKGIIDNGRSEIVSHTFTHSFHGTNDDGGVFTYVKKDETTALTSSSFPIGSSTKEILAAKQVIEDCFGIESVTLIHAGIGVRTSDYKLSNGTVVPTYKTYFNKVLTKAIEDGKLIGSRGTFTVTDENSLVGKVNTPKTVYDRRVSGIYALMVENYDDTSLWTKYIDNAMQNGGWACFCIHNISDTQTSGHYIKVNQADALFKYTYDLADRVAMMNFTEATKYYQEWNSAKVTATAYKNESIKVKVTDNLDDKLFNEALTVKVSVPDGWQSAEAKVGSTTKNLSVMSNADGSKYVLVDLVPDKDEALILGK